MGHKEIDELYAHTCKHCLAIALNEFPLIMLASKGDVFKKVLNDYKTGTAQSINTDLFNIYNDNYNKAITGVFGTLSQGDKYFVIAEEFKLNMARLAAYKSSYASELLSQAALNPDTFAQKGEKILKMFNRWQATEYNTAIARCRTAKQFLQFKERADVFPNLEWLPSRSVHVREEHVRFYGLVLPINDPFWNENQPGNLYNCKCDWQQTDKEPTSGQVKSVQPHAGLDGNPASTGEIITDKHPYIRKVKEPKEIEAFLIDKILKSQRIEIREWGKSYLTNKTITGIEKADSVVFSMSGIKEAINQPHKDVLIKNVALYNIEKLIKDAVYYTSLPDLEGDTNKVFHYYKTFIKGKLNYIVLKETKHNNKVSFYSIVDKLKNGN